MRKSWRADVVMTAVLVVVSLGARAQTTPNAIPILSGPVNDATSSSTASNTNPVTFATTTLNLSCPSSATFKVSSTPDGTGNVLVDNYINMTITSTESGPQNICTGQGGPVDPNGPPAGNTNQTSCFLPAYESAAGGLIGQDPDTYARTYGVPPIDFTSDITSFFEGVPSSLSLRFDLVDYGGDLASTKLYLVTSCTQNGVSTESGGVSKGQPTVIPFQNGTTYQAQLNSGSTVTNTSISVTPILSDQASCDALVNLNPAFTGAHCFVYQNPDGSGMDKTAMFELTCPQLPSSPQCNPFDAELGTSFNLSANNPGFDPTNPFPGWLKGEGPDPAHPCTPPSSGPLFLSNQIDFFSLAISDPFTKGGSGGTGSCWVATYHTPNEAPTVTIVAPANGANYQLNENDASTKANYTCTTVNNSPGAMGPYLTPTSCTGTDNPGGAVASGAQFDTSTLGPHTFKVTVVDSATDNESQTNTYNVVAPATDVAIAEIGPFTVRTGGNITYAVGVGDLGPANAYNVVVTDPLPTGTTFVSATGNHESCSFVNRRFSCTSTPLSCSNVSGTVTCSVGTLTPLSLASLNGATIQITVKLGNTVTAGKTVKNTVSVSEAGSDPNLGNNSATWSTRVTH
jgi:uncharacterized repeat protein (TIGR01451 family)